MIAIERIFRHRFMIERLEQLQAEIARTSDSIYRIEDDRELIALNQAGRAIGFAVKAMEEAALEVRRECSPKKAREVVKEEVKATLELIPESPERIRRQLEKQS